VPYGFARRSDDPRPDRGERPAHRRPRQFVVKSL
jgi:hypothetical protein